MLVLGLLGPGHLGEVNESLDALGDLDERAVIDDGDDLALHLGAYREPVLDVGPRVGLELLEAQGHLVAVLAVLVRLVIDAEHLHLDVLAHLHLVGGGGEAAVGHVGDVEQAVDAAQIHERAVVGQVLHLAGDRRAHFERLQRLVAFDLALDFEHLAARHDDVVARLVALDDLEPQRLTGTQVRVEVADLVEIDLRLGQERLHADVDLKATLHAAGDPAFHDEVLLESFLDFVPDAAPVGLFLRELDIAALVLEVLDHDPDLVARLHDHLAGVVSELPAGHAALALVTDVDNDFVAVDGHDRARHDFAGANCLGRYALLEELGKTVT